MFSALPTLDLLLKGLLLTTMGMFWDYVPFPK